MSKTLLYAVNTTPTLIAEGEMIPMNQVVRRYGNHVDLLLGSTRLKTAGYYTVHVNATFTAPTADNISIALLQDGVAIPGATGTETVTTANTQFRSISFDAIVRVYCGGAPSLLGIRVTDGSINLVNASITVD